MPEMLKIGKSVTDGVRDLLRTLLEEKKVGAVLTLMRDNGSGTVNYGLITDPGMVDNAEPFYPIMPNNAGKLLSKITLAEESKRPIAAVVRPCELRAFVELIKRRQGGKTNIVTISSTCAGVLPLKKFAGGEPEKEIKAYWSAVSGGKTSPDIRETCGCCDNFIPAGADITVTVAGGENCEGECSLYIMTDEGAKLADSIQGKRGSAELESETISDIRDTRQKAKEKMLEETKKQVSGLDGLIEVFNSCVGCHGCRSVCPICYCRLCEFDSARNEYKPANFEIELHKRGGVRVPPNTVNFHVGRMTHMAISCVGCGMCSDICPADIPVSNIFIKTGAAVQSLFEYMPGRDIEELLPFTTFEEHELEEVED